MNNIENALTERIKELSCLYEVTSILASADLSQIESTLLFVVKSVKKAFQFPEKIEVVIEFNGKAFKTGDAIKTLASIEASILLFNQVKGQITVSFVDESELHFLKEEQQLIESIAIKIGDFLERVEIRDKQEHFDRQLERTDRLAILGEITAGIAHELNTPLTNILGFAQLMESEIPAPLKADLGKIIKSTIYAREVVKKLMFFACEMPQNKEKINLIPIIQEAIELLDATFRNNEIRYLFEAVKNEIWLRADSVQITQIVFNLLMNAIYFSPKKGLVKVIAKEDNNTICISICDEGTGISDKIKDKIFQPFYSTKPVGVGSGLGLSVVQGIVRSHNGTLSVEDNKPKGTIFKVEVPKDETC